MPAKPSTPVQRVRVVVTAQGWPCVQRVVVLLTARAYRVCCFTATPSQPEPYWQVVIGLRCDAAGLALLKTRLERIPAVSLVVTAWTPDDPCAPGTPGPG